MPTKVNVAPAFLKDVRRLAKKYPAVLKQFESLSEQLKSDERPGDKIPNVGIDVYKVRLPNPSAQRGKRGGFRAIYYVQVADMVFLLRIYAKTEQEDITAGEIRSALEDVLPPDANES